MSAKSRGSAPKHALVKARCMTRLLRLRTWLGVHMVLPMLLLLDTRQRLPIHLLCNPAIPLVQAEYTRRLVRLLNLTQSASLLVQSRHMQPRAPCLLTRKSPAPCLALRLPISHLVHSPALRHLTSPRPEVLPPTHSRVRCRLTTPALSLECTLPATSCQASPSSDRSPALRPLPLPAQDTVRRALPGTPMVSLLVRIQLARPLRTASRCLRLRATGLRLSPIRRRCPRQRASLVRLTWPSPTRALTR